MADTATYDKIATQTLASAAASITFSSIAASWTDLRLVVVHLDSDTSNNFLRFNGDSGTNYSATYLYGNGTSASSFSITNRAYSDLGPITGSTTVPMLANIDIFSYAGSTYKTTLTRLSEDYNGTGATSNIVTLWRNTSAITSIVIGRTGGTYSTGTTATLYGIKSA